MFWWDDDDEIEEIDTVRATWTCIVLLGIAIIGSIISFIVNS